MARPKPAVELTPLGFRLPVTLVARLDAYSAAMSERIGGHSISRSDAIRVLLDRALNAEGFSAPISKPARQRSARNPAR